MNGWVKKKFILIYKIFLKMINKILIFRTDRIGDLIITCPAVITIRKYFKECEITIITSSKNHQYAKSLNLFDNVIQFPKKNIFNKIKFIYTLRKKNFDYIYVFDGKERSIITSLFLKSKIKVALSNSIKIHYNFLKMKFIKDVMDEKIVIYKNSKKNIVEELIKLEYKKIEGSYNYLINMPLYNFTIEKIQELGILLK